MVSNNLAIAVTADGRDAHARQHFAQTFFDRGAIARRATLSLLGARRSTHGEIRMHRARSRSDQQRNVMGIDDLALSTISGIFQAPASVIACHAAETASSAGSAAAFGIHGAIAQQNGALLDSRRGRASSRILFKACRAQP